MNNSSKPLILFGLVVIAIAAFFIARPSVKDSPYPDNFELAQSRQQLLGMFLLTEPERVVFSIRSFEKEVEDGGFEQYLGSEAADHAEETIEALEIIGARRTKLMLESAITTVFSDRLPPDELEDRRKALNNLAGRLGDTALDNLDELDSRFQDKEDDLRELVNAWLKR